MPGPLGAGLAQGAADIKQLHALWQQQMMSAQTEGRAFPQFEQWLMMQGIKLPAMPPAPQQQAQGVSLRGISDMPQAPSPSY